MEKMKDEVSNMSRNSILRVIGGIGIVACLAGLFANLVAMPAAYPLLDAMFAGGAATALVSAIIIQVKH